MKNVRAIKTSTQVCAVIGNPVAHSLSPAIHNAAFEELGLDFIYVAFQVEDVKNALAGMRAFENFRGLSVTIPHKIEAMNYVDEIASVDRSIGSINTIIHTQGKLLGSGTDGPGALKAIKDAGVETKGRNVLMLGSGGAARAIAFTLARAGSLKSLSILDIDTNMVNRLAADLQAGADTPIGSASLDGDSLATAMEAADIIIHCTPVGMHPGVDASLVPAALFRPGQVVFDIVYNPLETKLLRDAGAKGLIAISGAEMFINQAALQFELFTGREAPVELMRQVVMRHLNSR